MKDLEPYLRQRNDPNKLASICNKSVMQAEEWEQRVNLQKKNNLATSRIIL